MERPRRMEEEWEVSKTFPRILADLVFVHGLKGHPQKTWQHGKSTPDPEIDNTRGHFSLRRLFHRNKGEGAASTEGKSSKSSGCYWPFDLLISDFNNIRILTYGYDSHPSHFYASSTNLMNISEHGLNLLQKVVDSRRNCQTRPIIFVAHSLGGILVKEAIVESKKYEKQPRMQKVAKFCRAIVFFGTPHSGADVADWGRILTSIIKAVPLGFSTNDTVLRGLSPDSEKLANLTRDFNDILNADIPDELRLRIFTFQEGKGMTRLNLFDGKVVPTSSSGYFSRRDIEKTENLNENHMNMCRFSSASDPGYVSFKNNLEDYLDDIQRLGAAVEHRANALLVHDASIRREALLAGLNYEGRCNREDQLWDVRAAPVTFDWVWSSKLTDWAAGTGGLFWICGKPASGKSTLMEYLARSDELSKSLSQANNESWIVVHHYFFDFGVKEDFRNNFEGFLRSLLYQLTKNISNPQGVDVGAIETSLKSGTEQKWSMRTIYETVIKTLNSSTKPICILLDGLDEFQGDSGKLAEFIREVSNSRVKLCVASRPNPLFNSVFRNTPQFKMQDLNGPGIDVMVKCTILSDLANSSFYEDKEILQIAKEISEKADGVFLWARFAVRELRDSLNEGVDLNLLRKRLEEIPIELEQIYARIFRQLKPDLRKTAADMLRLVCYAERTLALSELQVATAHAARERPLKQPKARDTETFERRILAATGGVLEVFWGLHETSRGRNRNAQLVNVIHRTVRTYLERDGWSNVLGAAHQGLLHGHVLWLHVCTQVFHKDFQTLPPHQRGDSDSMLLQRLSTQPISTHSQASSNVLLRWYESSNATDELSPLLSYAAIYMLDHAAVVEQDLALSLHEMLHSAMSVTFACHHMYGDSCHTCCLEFMSENRWGYLEPLHPLHLAISHGLHGYVKWFLATVYAKLPLDDPERDMVFQVEIPNEYPADKLDTSAHLELVLDATRVCLLEFSIHHAWENGETVVPWTRIVAAVLEHHPYVCDADLACALQISSFEIVQLLLPHFPDCKLVLEISPGVSEVELGQEMLHGDISALCPGTFAVSPLWYLARRRPDNDYKRAEIAKLIDLFLLRGEKLNEQCGPFGSALHGALLRLAYYSDVRPMLALLVTKGADINISGPFGTPLALVWRLINKTDHESKMKRVMPYKRAIEWLISEGAVNDTCDPNGSIPSRERMLSFAEDPLDDSKLCIEKYMRDKMLYRGELTEEESEWYTEFLRLGMNDDTTP